MGFFYQVFSKIGGIAYDYGMPCLAFFAMR